MEDLPDPKANPVICWIDSNFTAVTGTFTALKRELPQLHIHKCGSTGEATIWLDLNHKQISGKLFVVTNRVRGHDGGDYAWEKTVETIRDKWPEMPIVVFCGEPHRVYEKAARWKKVAVTDSPSELLKLLKGK